MPTPESTAAATRQFLRQAYPNARYELDWDTPLELLVATILAAQCTDELVNRVTKTLFRKYRRARDYADADAAALEKLIKPTGAYRNKAKAIRGACQTIVDQFDGQVPRTMDELTTLPGVARKTANVVLNTAFNIPSGVIVDTHVARVSRRLGLTENDDPESIERDLMNLVPESEWTFFGPAMVLHGRYTCTAVRPKCPQCGLNGICPKIGVTEIGDGDRADEDEEASEVPPTPPTPPPRRKSRAREPGARELLEAFVSTVRAYEEDAAGDGGGSADAGDDDEDSLYRLPPGWEILAEELDKPYFRELARFVAAERRQHEVFPPPGDVYAALAHTPYEKVSVLLLGQDPYHDIGQAHGLCFSVREGVRPPPSLVNIFKELRDDLGVPIPKSGCLTKWADQGVLLLNAVMTVRAHQPNSHKDKGWEKFTDAVIRKVSDKLEPVAFVLWGGYAQKKEKLIDTGRHTVIKSAHPSPLSAANGFFGSRPFSQINDALRAAGKAEVDWAP